MVAHGSARATFDLHLCYERSKENISALSQALKPVHARLRGAPEDLPFVFDEKTIKAGLNFTLATDLGDLDLLGEVSGLGFYADVLKASVVQTAAGVRVEFFRLTACCWPSRLRGARKIWTRLNTSKL